MALDIIIQLIMAITGAGGILALFLITEKKTAARLENSQKIDEKWQKIVEQKEKDIASLSEKYEAAVAKIDKLYEVTEELRTKMDQVNTECAVSQILRCNRIACADREPPLSTLSKIEPPADEQ